MPQSNPPVSNKDISNIEELSDDRTLKGTDHCHAYQRSVPRPKTYPTEHVGRKQPQTPTPQTSELQSLSGCPRNPSSLFSVSPIEDALIREMFNGRFTF